MKMYVYANVYEDGGLDSDSFFYFLLLLFIFNVLGLGF